MVQQTSRTVEELDEEFKNILKKIHPYFKELKSNSKDKSLCQKWLHKLFKADKHDMKLRNEYLSELLEQLKNDELNEPFTKPPKNKGLLLPLPIRTHTSMQNLHIDSKTMAKKNLNNSFWDVFNCQNIANVDHDYISDFLNSNGHNIEKIEEKYGLNYKRKSDFFDISEAEQMLQVKKPTADKCENGDGCGLDREIKTTIESFGDISKKLQTSYESLENRLNSDQLRITSNTDRIEAEIIAELTKVNRTMEAMSNQYVDKTLEDVKRFNTLVEKISHVDQQADQFMEVARDLRSVMEESYDQSLVIKDMIKSYENAMERFQDNKDEKNGRIEEEEKKVNEFQANVDLNRRDAADAADAADDAGTPRVSDKDDDFGGDDDDNSSITSP